MAHLTHIWPNITICFYYIYPDGPYGPYIIIVRNRNINRREERGPSAAPLFLFIGNKTKNLAHLDHLYNGVKTNSYAVADVSDGPDGLCSVRVETRVSINWVEFVTN